MREFVVDLTKVSTFDEFVVAFNDGFCRYCDGQWHGRSWDAFHDYLSWPGEREYRLVFDGWAHCQGLRSDDKTLILQILADNAHVEAVMT